MVARESIQTVVTETMNPLISVIVLAWNGEEFLDASLSALLDQEYTPFEIIAVDNCSSDQSLAVLRRYEARIHLIQNDYNFGFAGGNNIGIKAAGGEIVVLLNQDVIVQPGWLQAIADTFAADPTIGIVGCKSLYPDGKTLQHAGAWLRAGDAFAYHKGQGEIDTGQHEALYDAQYVTGAAFAIHRRVLEQLGGLDPFFYPAFYEEADYCFQARNLEFRVVYQPRAVIYHHETTTLPAQSYRRIAAFQRNRVRLILRHWDAEALAEFVETEQKAITEGRWIDDMVARSRAYWDNRVRLAEIVHARREHRSLGPALTEGQVRWLAEALQSLRQECHERLQSLFSAESSSTHPTEPQMKDTNQPVGSSNASGVQVDPSLVPVILAQLQAVLQQIEKQQELKEHMFHSDLPLIGGLVARIRSFWVSVATRWYVLPVMHQQSLLNQQIYHSFQLLIGALAQVQQEQAQQQLIQQERTQQQLKLLQKMSYALSNDDAATVDLLHELTNSAELHNRADIEQKSLS
jgi:GT2 family glycosyltransferase